MKKDTSNIVLLDVNVLMALAWPNHQFHAAASHRMNVDGIKWATCALTELGFVRLSSNASVVGISKSPLEAAMLLAVMMKDPGHVFLKSMPSPVSSEFKGIFNGILGSKQVTDAYLLALAEKNRATLLTFDARIAACARSADLVEILT